MEIEETVSQIKAMVNYYRNKTALLYSDKMINAAKVTWRQVFTSNVNRHVVTVKLFGVSSTNEFDKYPEIAVTILKWLNPQNLNGAWTYNADALKFLRQYEVLIAKEQGQMELFPNKKEEGGE